jgi:Zn-dependent protease with chaperone function
MNACIKLLLHSLVFFCVPEMPRFSGNKYKEKNLVYSILLLEADLSISVNQSDIQRLIKAIDRPLKEAAINFTKELIRLSSTGEGIKHTLKIIILVCAAILAVCVRPTEAFASILFTQFLTVLFNSFGSVLTSIYGIIIRLIGSPAKIIRKLQDKEIAKAATLPWTLLGAFLGVTFGLSIAVVLNPAVQIQQLLILSVICLTLYIGYEIFAISITLMGGTVLNKAKAEKLVNSGSLVDRGIGKAYLLAIEKNPSLVRMKITYNTKDGGLYKTSPGAFVLPYPKRAKIYLTGTNVLERTFTEQEITAVILHEIGHIVTQTRLHPIALIIQHALTGIPIIAIAPFAALQVVLFVLYGLYLSYKKLYSETLADSYAVLLNHGPALESALKKLDVYYQDLSRQSMTQGIISGFLSHYGNMRTRLKIIRALEEQARKLGTKAAPKVQENMTRF